MVLRNKLCLIPQLYPLYPQGYIRQNSTEDKPSRLGAVSVAKIFAATPGGNSDVTLPIDEAPVMICRVCGSKAFWWRRTGGPGEWLCSICHPRPGAKQATG